MTNRKNNNSIIFLTTLGVYLGLLLVGGAAPQVYAHAAMTRNFEIQDEIEIKDDLDKNPGAGDLESDVSAIEDFKIAEAIRTFFSDVRKLENIGKFDPQKDWIFSHKLWLEEYDTTAKASKNSDISNRWLEAAVDQLISKAGNGNVGSISDSLPHCKGKNCRESRIIVESTASEFTLTFAFTKSAEEAAIFAERVNQIFAARRQSQKNSVDLPLYENTKATVENDQVLIITRLARASIDPLLAKDAK